ncbi:MAG: hypothetical protein IJA36_06835 [Lachnospiraceae bacterium]|nr:hypothetical protein [Lachnospiraceae bacterium]
MKKAKKVLAIIGIIFLAGLYVSSLIFALIDSELSFKLLQVSLYATVIIPILIYIYTLIYKLLHKD